MTKGHNKLGIFTDASYKRYSTSLSAFGECFGNIPISKVTQLDYRDFLRKYGEGCFLGERPNGRTTENVKKLHGCIKVAFEDAFKADII